MVRKIIFIFLVVIVAGCASFRMHNDMAKLSNLIDSGDFVNAAIFGDSLLLRISINYGKNADDYVSMLGTVGILHAAAGINPSRGIALLKEYLEVSNKTVDLLLLDSNGSVLIKALATCYVLNYQFEDALALQYKELNHTENNICSECVVYIAILHKISETYYRAGDIEKAFDLANEAMKRLKAIDNQDDYLKGMLVSTLADIYFYKGDIVGAVEIINRYLDDHDFSINDSLDEYGFYQILSRLYISSGQVASAYNLIASRIIHMEKKYGIDHPLFIEAVNDLFVLFMQYELWDEAGQLLGFIESRCIDGLTGNIMDLVYCLNVSGYYSKTGQPTIAREYLESIEGLFKHKYGNNDKMYAAYLNHLGMAYLHTGDYLNSKACFSREVDIYAKNDLPLCSKEHLHAILHMAQLHEIFGHVDSCILHYLPVMDCIRDQVGQVFSFSLEKDKEMYLLLMIDPIRAVLQSFYFRHSYLNIEMAHVYDSELLRKGLVLHSGIQFRGALQGSGDHEVLGLFNNWISLRDLLAKQYSLPASARMDGLKALEEEAYDLEARLMRQSAAFTKFSGYGSARWQDVQDALQDGEVAVEFSSFPYRCATGWTDSIMYIALLLRAGDSAPVLVPLFEQRQLDSLLQPDKEYGMAFVNNIYRGAGSVMDFDLTRSGHDLYDLVWRPLESYLQPGDHIYFASSGSLNQLAFAALPVSADTLLCDRYRLYQVTSTARLLDDVNELRTSPGNIMLYGGIDYESDVHTVIKSEEVPLSQSLAMAGLPADFERGGNWSYLPGTLREVQQIEALAMGRGIPTTVLVGELAAEDAYKQLSGRESPDVLHIATHGYFFPDPVKKYRDELIDGREENIFRASENPLKRSGLLLAGANHVWTGGRIRPGDEDGILTAYEVSNVILRNTRLVVLSACETGLGDIRGSEGVFGLQRAFKAAGAEYLIMSLWKVPDTETSEFMTYFYTTWLDGTPIEDAFHATQLYMKAKYSDDPYKWAAFVLVR